MLKTDSVKLHAINNISSPVLVFTFNNLVTYIITDSNILVFIGTLVRCAVDNYMVSIRFSNDSPILLRLQSLSKEIYPYMQIPSNNFMICRRSVM